MQVETGRLAWCLTRTRTIFDGQIAPSQTQILLKLLIDHGSDITSRGADQLTCEEMLIARHHQVSRTCRVKVARDSEKAPGFSPLPWL
jgi:hypothetical protein